MNGCAKCVMAMPIGMPIVFVGLIVVSGGVENAVGILATSVICTAGLGLLFWLPLCCGVGYVVVAVFEICSRTPDSDSPFADLNDECNRPNAFEELEDTGQSPVVRPIDPKILKSKEVAGLVRYMTDAQSKGLTPAVVDEGLRSARWREESIRAARWRVETE